MSIFYHLQAIHRKLNTKIRECEHLSVSELMRDLEDWNVSLSGLNSEAIRIKWLKLMYDILLAIQPYHFMLRNQKKVFRRLHRTPSLNDDVYMFERECKREEEAKESDTVADQPDEDDYADLPELLDDSEENNNNENHVPPQHSVDQNAMHSFLSAMLNQTGDHPDQVTRSATEFLSQIFPHMAQNPAPANNHQD